MKRLLDGMSLRQLARDFLRQLLEDKLLNAAAALAFYLTLAIFPALIFLLSVLPYLPIADLHQAIMDLVRQVLPREAAEALTSNVEKLTTQRQGGGLLSVGLIGAPVVASTGMYAIMQQLNVTHSVDEGRPFLKARGTALLLTLLSGALIISALALVVLGGQLQSWIASSWGWSEVLLAFFATLRWVIIVSALLLGFSLVYCLGPNVDQKFRWVAPGTVMGVGTLVLASLGFRAYVENFGHYDATYGSIGAFIVLMLWLFFAGLVLLAGSEVNVLYEKHLPGGKKRGERRPGEKARRARPDGAA